MRVHFTSDIFSRQVYGGISRYIIEIAREIRAQGHDVSIFAGIHVNRQLRDDPDASGFYLPRFPLANRVRRKVNSTLEYVALRRSPPDVIHESYYSGRSHSGSGIKIVTVHDMIHELFPQYFQGDTDTTAMKLSSCRNADAIIAISQATKNDLVRVFGVEEAKVHVISHGVSIPRYGRTTASGADPAVLFVGGRSHYKNFRQLAIAFSVARIPREYRLVCFGGGALMPDERRYLAELKIEDRVDWKEGDDEALWKEYQGSSVLVYPSIYEGFGLPILEAMAAGCPVLCSRASSIPEVAGDAAEYFDPLDVDSISHALEITLSAPRRLDALIREGTERVKQFTWKRCAAETVSLYQRIVG